MDKTRHLLQLGLVQASEKVKITEQPDQLLVIRRHSLILA
jgi:hypothetical protein